VQAGREIVAKFGLHHDDPNALQFAANEMMYLGTSGAPGMYGLGGGRPRPSGLIQIHSALLDKSLVTVTVQLGDDILHHKTYQTQQSAATPKYHIDQRAGLKFHLKRSRLPAVATRATMPILA
jgi:hypothetical protein